MAAPGNLYIISAPSGTGKTTLVKTLIEAVPGITVSISHTTRPKRPAEIEGVNYYFVTDTQFNQMIAQDDFLEHAKVFNHSYGTSRTWVTETLQSGRDVILEIDWQGARQIKQLFPDCISIFILPPSLSALALRLQQRNQDKPEVIEKRLADAKHTISHLAEYNYLVLNDNFQTATADLKTIIEAGRLLSHRQLKKYTQLAVELGLTPDS